MKRYLSVLFAALLFFSSQTAAFAGMAYAPNNLGYWVKTASTATPNEVVPNGTTNQISVNASTAEIGVANNAIFPGTTRNRFAQGTTAQRDGSPSEGDFRFNTTDHIPEWWNGSSWVQSGTSAGIANGFDTVKVSSQSDVSASGGDDLTLVAGTNVTITTDAGAKSVTINSSGGGGSGATLGGTCEGRLSLESGVPVSTSDQLAKTTVYFTPYYGNHISLIESGAPADHTFSELSLSTSGWTDAIPRDIWGRDSDGNSTMDELTSTAWSNATTRSTAIEYIGGVPVKDGGSSENAYRLLGTVLPSATGQIEDSTKHRGVCQAAPQSRVLRLVACTDGTDSWSYTTTTLRTFNNSTTLGTARINTIASLPDVAIKLDCLAVVRGYNQGTGMLAGIGVDSTSVNSATLSGHFLENATSIAAHGCISAFYRSYQAIGSHAYYPLESGGANGVFYGDGGGTVKSGLSGYAVM